MINTSTSLDNKTQELEVKLLFNDITSQCKFVNITYEELKKAFELGIKVDGSDIIGLTGICENEFILWPIISSKKSVHLNDKNIQLVYECKVTTIDGIDVKEIENELLQTVLNEAQILGLQSTNKNQLLSILFPKTKTSIIHFAS
jgi:glutamine synthetase